LIERAEQVVSRAELRDRLWSAETFVDFEQGLNTAVKELRAVLNDSSDQPRYIETLPKLGYRFIAPVETVTFEAPKQSRVQEESVPLEIVNLESVVSARFHPAPPLYRWIVVGALGVLIAGLGVYWQSSRAPVKRPPASAKFMLAVLPFENLTGDAGQEYLSDGLTEELITQLGRLDPQRVGIIARTSVMRYKNRTEKLSKIGQELGVQYVLQGSVRRNSDKVRIAAQLLQVADQTHIWAREYDRELSDLLALQGEIAQEISEEIQLTLGGGQKLLPSDRKLASTASYEAYDLYLKGRYFWNKRTKAGFHQAADYFQQAIAKDPHYAPPYAGLADTYALMSSWYMVPQNEYIPKARVAALQALQIDETLAEAHTSLALIAENYDYDWQTAEKEYKRAIQLDPGYATAHQWYAECLSLQARFEEASAENERARRLDPLSLIIASDEGALLYFSRHYDRAIAQLRAVLEMEPRFDRAHLIILAYVQEGRFEDALADIKEWRRINDIPGIWAYEAYVYGRWGRRAEARRAFAKFEQLTRDSQPETRPLLLLAFLGMDRRDDAITFLQKSYAEHSNAVVGLKVEPNYDRLRGDPRFQELLRRIGLGQ
jgi:TolB-like protein/Flp pilus assembly protein TadD